MALLSKMSIMSLNLALRFLGNELIAIKMAAHNFSGKLIVYSILLLLFSFMLIEVFEVHILIMGVK